MAENDDLGAHLLAHDEDIDSARLRLSSVASIQRVHEEQSHSSLKGFLLLCSAFYFLFGALCPLQNLMSSELPEGGLGATTIGISFVAMFLGCVVGPRVARLKRKERLRVESFFPRAAPSRSSVRAFRISRRRSFVAPALIGRVGASHALAVSSTTFVVYCAANLVPSWATLLPASVLLGSAASVLWVACGEILTMQACDYAAAWGSDTGHMIGIFNSCFWAVFQLANLSGNAFMSLLLTRGALRVRNGAARA